LVIGVTLHTVLQAVSAAGRTSRISLELPPGATVQDVLDRLQVPIAPEHLILVVNRAAVDPDAALQDGDTLDLIPAISGG
jgi:molybdopterin converting factor small subunit